MTDVCSDARQDRRNASYATNKFVVANLANLPPALQWRNQWGGQGVTTGCRCPPHFCDRVPEIDADPLRVDGRCGSLGIGKSRGVLLSA